MLADDEVQLGVVGQAVALVRRAPNLAHAASRVPAPAHVGRHVGEQQIVVDRVPDRPLGEGEAGADLADRRVDVDQLLELGAQRGVGHGRRPRSAHAGNQLRFGSDCTIGPGT